jgi:hypothetical protein
MHAYIHTHIQGLEKTYIHTYTHTYIHTRIHTYTLTHIHIHGLECLEKPVHTHAYIHTYIYKAWNAWKSQYQQRVANRIKSNSQASMMTNNEDDCQEEVFAKDLAETRALQRLADRRSGNGNTLNEDEVPTWVPIWGFGIYAMWQVLKRQVLKIRLLCSDDVTLCMMM